MFSHKHFYITWLEKAMWTIQKRGQNLRSHCNYSPLYGFQRRITSRRTTFEKCIEKFEKKGVHFALLEWLHINLIKHLNPTKESRVNCTTSKKSAVFVNHLIWQHEFLSRYKNWRLSTGWSVLKMYSVQKQHVQHRKLSL